MDNRRTALHTQFMHFIYYLSVLCLAINACDCNWPAAAKIDYVISSYAYTSSKQRHGLSLLIVSSVSNTLNADCGALCLWYRDKCIYTLVYHAHDDGRLYERSFPFNKIWRFPLKLVIPPKNHIFLYLRSCTGIGAARRNNILLRETSNCFIDTARQQCEMERGICFISLGNKMKCNRLRQTEGKCSTRISIFFRRFCQKHKQTIGGYFGVYNTLYWFRLLRSTKEKLVACGMVNGVRYWQPKSISRPVEVGKSSPTVHSVFIIVS